MHVASYRSAPNKFESLPDKGGSHADKRRKTLAGNAVWGHLATQADSAGSATGRGEAFTPALSSPASPIVQRLAVETGHGESYVPSESDAVRGDERVTPEYTVGGSSRPAAVPSPETCPPPEDLACRPAGTSPGALVNEFGFGQNVHDLSPLQRLEVDATAAAWHTAGSSMPVRVDGYASAEGACDYNWRLSCRRAEAVAAGLRSPSDGSPGVPTSAIDLYAHGETDAFGRGLTVNRKATISIPVPPPPPAPPPASCRLPVSLGRARGCGSADDFRHFDFPSISWTSEAKLAAWAAAVSSAHLPIRALVSDTYCMSEMGGVLGALAGSAGLAAFARFVAGTGGTATHRRGSTLGSLALVSGSFLRTAAIVQRGIEAQLAAQSASGALDACALRVTPPATHFAFSDGSTLKAVIGGTQGEELIAVGFTGSIPMRTYTIDLEFKICDDFGVDESDLYAPGLIGFWVLQHERSPSLYAPFINELVLPVTLTGTF